MRNVAFTAPSVKVSNCSCRARTLFLASPVSVSSRAIWLSYRSLDIAPEFSASSSAAFRVL